MNWDNVDWDNFSCVDVARKLKDEMSAKLNAMTSEEELAYYKRSYQESVQRREREQAEYAKRRAREQANTSAT